MDSIIPRLRWYIFIPIALALFILVSESRAIAAGEKACGQQRPDGDSATGARQPDVLRVNYKSGDDRLRLPAVPEMEFKIRWRVSSVSFAPNGTYLAFADFDRGVYLWDLMSRKKAWMVELPSLGAVAEEDVAVVFTRDSKNLLLASYCRDPLVLDASSGRTLRTFGREGEWFAPAISTWQNDGKETAITSSDGDIHLWSPSNAKEVIALKGAGQRVVSLHAAKKAARIAVGLEALGFEDQLENGRVLVRELPSGRILLDVRQSQFPVRQLAISPNGKYVVGASEEGLVCWSVDRKERLWSVKEVCGGLAMSPDGKMLVYGSGSQVVLCDVHSGKTVSATRYGSHTISAVTFADDGASFAIGTDDGAVAVWKLLPAREENGPTDKGEKR